MYKKILVPLDGSELAECVLPHVEAFIEGFNPSDLILVRVVEPEKPYHGEYAIDTEMIEKRQSETMSIAKEYLDQIVNRLKNEDLIIIATHGYSGITRWVRGSVADKILRSANVPVLMVRAPGTKGGI
jgi:nucleotide-binding universal stress UspA family protein